MKKLCKFISVSSLIISIISCGSVNNAKYFNIVSETKEENSIKVIVEAQKTGMHAEDIFLVSKFINKDNVIVNTSMSQIGPMMFDKGKYEFNIPFPTNKSFDKYENSIREIPPEEAKRVSSSYGMGMGSFFTTMMLMNAIGNMRPSYYDDYGYRRTIDRDYYDRKYSATTTKRTGGWFQKSSSAAVDDNDAKKRRELYEPTSGSSTRKKSTTTRSSSRRGIRRR